VNRTSISRIRAPARKAFANAGRVFSGALADAPRCAAGGGTQDVAEAAADAGEPGPLATAVTVNSAVTRVGTIKRRTVTVLPGIAADEVAVTVHAVSSPTLQPVLVLSRYRVPDLDSVEFRGRAEDALAVLGEQAGFVRGHLGRNVDEPDLWVLSTEWESVGTYRRALSSYDVKIRAVPVMLHALDEPSAYEVLGTRRGG
jgi:hypothetical protein